MRKSGKTFRCYVVYTKGSIYNEITNRKGPYHWVAAMDVHQAREFVNGAYVEDEIKKGEEVGKIVATAFPEDKALNAQGVEGLPFEFGDS